MIVIVASDIEKMNFSVPEINFKNRSEMMSCPPGFSEIDKIEKGLVHKNVEMSDFSEVNVG